MSGQADATGSVLLAIRDLQTGLNYLARLPLANPEHAENAVNRFLDSLRAAPPPVEIYLELLEQTRVPACFVVEELARRYQNKALPLGETEERVFRQAVDMWRRLVSAYADCARLDASEDGAERDQRTALILHRCISYTAAIMNEFYRARHELPAGLWLELHGYYASAEEWGVALTPVPDALDLLQRPTHCRAAFVAALLVDLGGPYGLSVREQTIVRRWAHHWAPLVGVAAAQPGEALPAFVVDLMGDQGIRPVGECLQTENVRRLETVELALRISEVRAQLDRHRAPPELGLGEDCTHGQCVRLLEHLVRPWTQARAPRKFRRHAASGIARVVDGSEAIYYAVSGTPFVQPDNVRYYSRREFDTLFVFRHMEDPSAALQSQPVRSDFAPDPWEVVNQSVSGFRLIRSLAGKRLVHGQLLALRPHDGERFLLAQTTWLMQDRSGGLVAGVAALPGLPQAVAARPRGDGETRSVAPYHPAFLLPEVPAIGAERSLVLPSGFYQIGRIIELHAEGDWHVRLDRMLQQGPDFERVSFIVCS